MFRKERVQVEMLGVLDRRKRHLEGNVKLSFHSDSHFSPNGITSIKTQNTGEKQSYTIRREDPKVNT